MSETTAPARILWDYLRLDQEIAPMDAVLAFGSDATRVAERAADLLLEGYGRYLIVSGGPGTGLFGKAEGDAFADIARRRGVPEDLIIVERNAANTGENIAFVRELLRERGLALRSFLLVHKPYLERRVYAAFRKQWPDADCIVTSPHVSFEQYARDQASAGRLVHFMREALYRIKTYPEQGFQIPQEIPDEVTEAYESLRALGHAGPLAGEA